MTSFWVESNPNPKPNPSSLSSFPTRLLCHPLHISASAYLYSPKLIRPSPPRVSTTPVDYALSAPDFDFSHQLTRLRALRSRLSSVRSLQDKHRLIDGDPNVSRLFRPGSVGFLARASRQLGLDSLDLFLLKCLVAARQQHVLGIWEVDDDDEEEPVRSSVKIALYAFEIGRGVGKFGI